MAAKEEFDLCVIGTGAGGGVMIQELTEAGFRVVALQRGPFLTAADFLNNDELEITVGVAERRRASLMLKQEALCQGEPMARALVQAACVRCADLKPAPLPPGLLARLPKRLDEHSMNTR